MKRFHNQKGQTSVEYVLLIAAIVAMFFSISTKVQQYMVGTGNCPNSSLTCTIVGFIQGQGALSNDPNQAAMGFRYFLLRK